MGRILLHISTLWAQFWFCMYLTTVVPGPYIVLCKYSMCPFYLECIPQLLNISQHFVWEGDMDWIRVRIEIDACSVGNIDHLDIDGCLNINLINIYEALCSTSSSPSSLFIFITLLLQSTLFFITLNHCFTSRCSVYVRLQELSNCFYRAPGPDAAVMHFPF